MSATPRVSVVIAAYQPGGGFDRVMASLDAQTLPQEEFETIVVDDGSPDDTFDRLSAFAATRPNMRVERIENSGWPSRPRNVGTDLARGEYVLFMDHDDSLFPDGLRAAYDFAKANASDVVSPKESRTNDPWWAMLPLMGGDVPDALAGGIEVLRPMVPHKLYRREFLNEHGIRFPEGRRMLWEDNYQNVEVYRHAKVVSLLAGTPVYLWHSSDANNSRTYGPMSSEFWDRLDDLTAAIDATLDTDEFADARRSALQHEHRWRLLHRLTRATVANEDGPEMDQAYDRANRIQARYIPEEWDAELGTFDRLRAALIRARRTDLVRQAYEVEQRLALQVDATAVRWDGGVLRFQVAAQLLDGLQPLGFRSEGDRLHRVVPDAIAAAVPAAVLDVTDEVDRFDVLLAVRSRDEPVTWPVQAELTVRREVHADGTVGMVAVGEASLDLATAQAGSPLAAGVWDVIAQSRWGGLGRRATPKAKGVKAVLQGGRATSAYANTKGGLTLDTSQRLRSVVRDGGLPVDAPLGRTGKPFRLTLPKVVVAEPTTVPLTLVAVASDGTTADFPAAVVGDEGGAHLTSRIDLPGGTYDLQARGAGQEATVALRRELTVKRDGVLTLHRPAAAPAESVVERLRQRGHVTTERVGRAIRRRLEARRGR